MKKTILVLAVLMLLAVCLPAMAQEQPPIPAETDAPQDLLALLGFNGPAHAQSMDDETASSSMLTNMGAAMLYLGGGLLVVSSVAVMFDKRLD